VNEQLYIGSVIQLYKQLLRMTAVTTVIDTVWNWCHSPTLYGCPVVGVYGSFCQL